jgi:ethanolamine ammonia-lyase small subunit
MKPPAVVTSSPLAGGVLAGCTQARIALGRSGSSLPTAAHLRFVGDHARARDAVWTAVDFDALARSVEALGLVPVRLRSEAGDRATYLRRPDLGRRLCAQSQAELARVAAAPQGHVAIVVADGLSAEAVQVGSMPLVEALLPELRPFGPPPCVCLVEQGRVAIGDAIGEALGADLVIVLVGERPGLSTADSLGCYVTWAPRPGTPDSRRNCISNIRDGGMPVPQAVESIVRLVGAAIERRATGVGSSGDPVARRLEV